ncbi:MAG: winged helix-turn-helix domain-containing protein [Candidatus Bathyarchaeota archaeon]|nr:winged helix-turn-helix domain-containing protein [Candidatus Bathyarchaeota archaeon]
MASYEESLAEYVILSVRKPSTADYTADLEWFCRTFGFLESRDKQKTAYLIFKSLVEAAAHNTGLTSDELAEKLGLTRGTMIHHLNKLMKSGMVIFHEGKFKLRERSLKVTVEEIHRDINRLFENVVEIAETIDHTLGLVSR